MAIFVTFSHFFLILIFIHCQIIWNFTMNSDIFFVRGKNSRLGIISQTYRSGTAWDLQEHFDTAKKLKI